MKPIDTTRASQLPITNSVGTGSEEDSHGRGSCQSARAVAITNTRPVKDMALRRDRIIAATATCATKTSANGFNIPPVRYSSALVCRISNAR